MRLTITKCVRHRVDTCRSECRPKKRGQILNDDAAEHWVELQRGNEEPQSTHLSLLSRKGHF